jgi:hypothetical protein
MYCHRVSARQINEENIFPGWSNPHSFYPNAKLILKLPLAYYELGLLKLGKDGIKAYSCSYLCSDLLSQIEPEP